MTRTADCRETNELLPWYINRTLDEDEEARVRAHLEICSSCRGELYFGTSVYEAIRATQLTADAVPDGLACLRFLESLVLRHSGHLTESVMRFSRTVDHALSGELVMDWMPGIARDLVRSMVA